VDAVMAYEQKNHLVTDSFIPDVLPLSLFTKSDPLATLGAIDLFNTGTWFSKSINLIEEKMFDVKGNNVSNCPIRLGDKIQQAILAQYQVKIFNESL
jgi:hypothetical protein